MAELTNLTNVLPEPLARKIENEAERAQFNDLLGLAWRTCLGREPEAVEPHGQPGGEAQVLQYFGLRGFRAALDIHQRFGPVDWLTCYEAQPVFDDTPIREPQLFSDPLELDMLYQTEAFGAALLREAYLCLGDDAREHMQRLHAARDDDAFADTLNWMHQRLRAMGVNEASHALAGNYHPARLAPRLIGAYPGHNTPPSCLGLSLIAASFLHEAGVEILHGGVMQRRNQEMTQRVADFCDWLPDVARDVYGCKLPPNMSELLVDRRQNSQIAALQDDSFHATILAEAPSGRWFQIDPAQGSCILDDEAMLRLHTGRMFLQNGKSLMPGLETIMWSPRLSPASRACEQMLAGGSRDMLATPEAVARLLRNAVPEALTQIIKQEVLEPFFKALRYDIQANIDWRIATNEPIKLEDGSTIETLDAAMYALSGFVLWDEAPQKVLDRCRRDEAYLWRRVEDIRALPFLTALWLMVEEVRYDVGTPQHTMLEIGFPAHRIGAAVLNDFATYCYPEIPPRLRLKAWPASQIPISETIRHEHASDQSALLQRLAHTAQAGLHYQIMDATVEPFLTNVEEGYGS
mgnify:CR=1 FL=1